MANRSDRDPPSLNVVEGREAYRANEARIGRSHQGRRAEAPHQRPDTKLQSACPSHPIRSLRSGRRPYKSAIDHQQSFYVAISRARDRAELVTDDSWKLADQLEKATGERVAALDVTARHAAHEAVFGREPSLDRDGIRVTHAYDVTDHGLETGRETRRERARQSGREIEHGRDGNRANGALDANQRAGIPVGRTAKSTARRPIRPYGNASGRDPCQYLTRRHRGDSDTICASPGYHRWSFLILSGKTHEYCRSDLRRRATS